MKRPYTPIDRHGRGFTIIEILVALAISLILLLGVINIFIASQTSYALQSGMARMQENGRFALDTMTRSLSLAGLGVNANQVFNTAATLDNSDQNPAPLYNFTTALGKASDRFSVRYQSATNCLGNATAGTGGIATDTFYIQNDANGVPNLYCNNQPLVQGVENMQILYGQDLGTSTVPPDGAADSYLTATNVTEWGDPVNGGITTVRIALLVSSIEDADIIEGRNEGRDTRVYELLNAPPMGPFRDKLARRVYTRTIVLRNYTYTQ